MAALLIRTLHVLAMAALVGGTTVSGTASERRHAPLAPRYS